MNVDPTLRTTVLLGSTPLAVGVIVASSIAMAGDLPVDAIPSHWSDGGVSDDTMPLTAFTALMAGLATMLGLGSLALRHRVGDIVSQRLLGGTAVGLPGAIAVIHVGTLVAARGTTGPIPFPGAAFGLAGAVLVVGGALGAALVRPIERHGRPLDAVPIAVQPGEAVVWVGRSAAPLWVWSILAVSAAVSAWAFVVADLPWVGVALAALLLAVASLLRSRTTVGGAGVTVRVGPFGLLRFHVPLADIDEVRAEQVDPLLYGGWGIRVLPGVRAIVLSRGPGLRVERRDGPALVVTVDEAGVAAGVLEAHRAAAR